jgi:hypothetical protein
MTSYLTLAIGIGLGTFLLTLLQLDRAYRGEMDWGAGLGLVWWRCD